MDEVKIAGIIFQHGPAWKNDFSYWTGFELSAEEESAIWAILEPHSGEGCSER